MRYKLLRDLPGYKAGTIFDNRNPDGDPQWFPVGESTTFTYINEMFKPRTPQEGWFEELPDTPTWPRLPERTDYWFIDDGQAQNSREAGTGIDTERYESGNYFKTREQAQAVADGIRSLLEYVHTPDREYSDLTSLERKIEAARVAVQAEE